MFSFINYINGEKLKNYFFIKKTNTFIDDIINDSMNNRYQWESIRANNASLLKMFEMKTVAQEYIDLIVDANRWVTMPIGVPSVGLKNSCDKNLAFFNIPPHFNAHTGTQLSF